MPPKLQISRQDIIDAAFDLVRKSGWAQLSARSIAKKLKSSTMPIYSQFKGIEGLEEEVVKKAIDLLAEYGRVPRTEVLSLNHGIAYVLFAWEEPYLFAAINDEKHFSLQIKYGDPLFAAYVKELTKDPEMAGFSLEQLSYFELLSWIFVRGVASLKFWVERTQGDFNEERLVEFMRDVSKVFRSGFIENQARSSKNSEKGKLQHKNSRKHE